MSYLKKLSVLISIILFQYQGLTQVWEQWYGKDDVDLYCYDITESYDFGYTLVGRVYPPDNITVTSWLVKMNINGDTIWTKTLIGGESLYINRISTTANGGFLLCGTIIMDTKAKPFAAKLNVCGEKEWCTVFQTYFELPWAQDIVEIPSGEIGVIINQFDDLNRSYLFKLDSSGELLWEKPVCSREEHPDSRLPYGRCLKIASNGDFLIAGDVYWKNPWDDIFPIRSLFVMIDQEGNEKWVLPFGLNDTILSHSVNIVEQPNGNFLGLGAYWGSSKKTPDSYFIPNESNGERKSDYEFRNGLLIEIDPNGNELNYFISDFTDIDPAFKYQVFSELFIVDSVAIIGGIFTDDTQFGNTGEIVIDTNFFDDDFNVYYRIKHENAHEPFSYAITSDNKMLCASTDWHTYDDYTMYLTKLNRYLEQDSLYTEEYEYDYLCDHPIESGTVNLDDCNMIVGVNNHFGEEKTSVFITTVPNPVQNIATINFVGLENRNNLQVQITDILGNLIYNSNLLQGQTELSLNTDSWEKGLYLIRLQSQGNIIATQRLIKL